MRRRPARTDRMPTLGRLCMPETMTMHDYDVNEVEAEKIDANGAG